MDLIKKPQLLITFIHFRPPIPILNIEPNRQQLALAYSYGGSIITRETITTTLEIVLAHPNSYQLYINKLEDLIDWRLIISAQKGTFRENMLGPFSIPSRPIPKSIIKDFRKAPLGWLYVLATRIFDLGNEEKVLPTYLLRKVSKQLFTSDLLLNSGSNLTSLISSLILETRPGDYHRSLTFPGKYSVVTDPETNLPEVVPDHFLPTYLALSLNLSAPIINAIFRDRTYLALSEGSLEKIK